MVNDTLSRVTGTVELGWFRLDGSERRTRTRRVAVPANGGTEVARDPLPPASRLDPREWVYAAILHAGAVQDQCILPLLPYRQLAGPVPKIDAKAEGQYLVFRSAAYCHGVHIEDGGRSLLEDNYFDLLPGVPRRVAMSHPPASRTWRPRAVTV